MRAHAHGRRPLGTGLTALGVLATALGVLASAGVTAEAGAVEPGRPITIVAPPDRTQAPQDGTVPVRIETSGRVRKGSVRALLVTGAVHVDLTGRLVTTADGAATTTLHAADLQPGVSSIVATARTTHGQGRVRATSSFSWEPTLDLATADRCDVLDPTRCLLPFPSDRFTVPDRRTATGRRVHFDARSMIANASGRAVDPTEWNRNDGFSPGSPIMTYVPGLDLRRTGAAPITDIGSSLRRDAPIVVLDATAGERWPYWAELDAQADPPDRRLLVVRPAKDMIEGHRYVVALRALRDGNGSPIAPGRAFLVYRDRIPTFAPAIESRRPVMDRLFRDLDRAGVEREQLDLAWDFTVASERSLSGRVLHIRDDGLASLHGGAPTFTVTAVENDVSPEILRRVTGTFTVPSYLTGTGAAGSRFQYASADPDALPQRNGAIQAGFICVIPRSVATNGGDPVHPARGVVYGHGLLGSNSEVNASNIRTMANAYRMVYCATKWIGFSNEDIGTAISTLQDISNFPKMTDRTQQGFLDFLFLARLLRDPHGLVSDPAFRMGASATPVLDGSVFYDGNSQGGILGGAVTAISTEWTRAVLGVPGMNYSTLLQRSSDWDTYATIYKPAYPDEMDRMLGFGLLQMLWDRAEANGYAQHMTDDPYEHTPEHQVLMQIAFGDHQVANVAAEVEARTIGARTREPALAPGRSPDVVPFWGIRPVPRYPWPGSAFVMWDSGNPAPPLGNLPPEAPQYGPDPHENPRRTPAAQAQKSAFLMEHGALVDTCGGAPCVAPP